MCGIIGSKGFEEQDIKNRLSRLNHRGNDASNIVSLLDNVIFGHNLLSIQGNGSNFIQPMSKYNYTITYNGEMWSGWKDNNPGTSVSSTDTEYLLNIFRNYGVEGISKLDGMFGFGLYDIKTGDIIVARDYLGKIPVYYYHNKDKFIFASEMKCFYGLPTKEVKLLNPGTYIKLSRDNTLSEIKYHNISSAPILDDRDTIIKNIRTKIEIAVEKRLISEVPLCTLLSGGIDSLIVTYLTKKYIPNVESFVISVGDNPKKKDDLYFARKIAKWMNIKLNEVIISNDDILNNLEEIVYFTEEKKWTQIASGIGQYILAKHMKKAGFKVVLTGEVSDEIFASYPMIKRWSWQEDQYVKERRKQIENVHNNNLIRSNKAILAGGTIEMRSPFGDKDFLEYAANIPAEFRFENSRMKPLLREAFKNEIPEEFIRREKVCMGEGYHADPIIKTKKEEIIEIFNKHYPKDGLIK